VAEIPAKSSKGAGEKKVGGKNLWLSFAENDDDKI
jgi:hypothetical protein